MYCPRCKTPREADQTFCRDCGSPLASGPRNSLFNLVLVAAAILLCALYAILGGELFGSPEEGPPAVAAVAVTETPAPETGPVVFPDAAEDMFSVKPADTAGKGGCTPFPGDMPPGDMPPGDKSPRMSSILQGALIYTFSGDGENASPAGQPKDGPAPARQESREELCRTQAETHPGRQAEDDEPPPVMRDPLSADKE